MDLTAFEDLVKEHCRYKKGDYVCFLSHDLDIPKSEQPHEYSLMRVNPIVSATINEITITITEGIKIFYSFKEAHGKVVQEKIIGIHDSSVILPDGTRTTFLEIRQGLEFI